MTHTTGPWKWIGTKLKNLNGKIVFTEPHFNTEPSRKQAESNRKLIASAPELLEALKNLVGKVAVNPMTEEAKKQAYTAIKNAES